jgi:hypothetical protein
LIFVFDYIMEFIGSTFKKNFRIYLDPKKVKQVNKAYDFAL